MTNDAGHGSVVCGDGAEGSALTDPHFPPSSRPTLTTTLQPTDNDASPMRYKLD